VSRALYTAAAAVTALTTEDAGSDAEARALQCALEAVETVEAAGQRAGATTIFAMATWRCAHFTGRRSAPRRTPRPSHALPSRSPLATLVQAAAARFDEARAWQVLAAAARLYRLYGAHPWTLGHALPPLTPLLPRGVPFVPRPSRPAAQAAFFGGFSAAPPGSRPPAALVARLMVSWTSGLEALQRLGR
jgi:hypothetical protein